MREQFRKIPVGHGRFALCDEVDYENLRQIIWAVAGGYVKGWHKGEKVQMHALVMPTNGWTDHINGNCLDNRRANLRPCTASQNAANTRVRRRNKLGIKGVDFKADCRFRPYRAQIMKDGKKILIGMFADAETASAAYQAKAKELFGEFAYVS